MYIGILAVIGIMYLYGNIQKHRAQLYQAEKEAALNTAIAQGTIIMQKDRTGAAVNTLENEQQAKQRTDQQKLDAGDRSGLDKDTF